MKGTQAVADKQPGATNIKAQADRKDLRPDLSSSDSIKHAVMDQLNNLTAAGCRILRGGVRREDVNVL